MAKPYAPLNEWLSLMTKAPGSRSFSRLIAATQYLLWLLGVLLLMEHHFMFVLPQSFEATRSFHCQPTHIEKRMFFRTKTGKILTKQGLGSRKKKSAIRVKKL